MDFITSRLYAFTFGIIVAFVGLVSPNACKEGLKTAIKENRKFFD